MANPEDETKTSHAPGSQPTARPDTEEPQTITAPTPPVAWTSDPPDQDDLTDEGDRSERSRPGDGPETTPRDG